MKNRVLAPVVALFLILFTLSAYAETKKITTMGQYTFARVRGDIPTQDVMKMLVDRYAADIKYGFELAGYGDLTMPFLDQLKAATFTEKAIPIGDIFPWMLFRSRSKVKVVKDVEWAGKAPLPVFSFIVNKDFKNYEFVIPKPCGNIALFKISEAIPEAVCDLKVSPAKANINDPITVDMSGSKYATSMTVTVYDSSGALLATQALRPDAPKWETKFDKPGEYILKAKAANQRGEVTGPGCEAQVTINFPPNCQLTTTCTECKNFVGRTIVFDASGSSDPDGELVKASFEVTDEEGNIVDSFMDTEKPFIWEKVFDKAGSYVVVVTVFDDMGAVAGGSEPCRIPFTITQKRLFFLVEAGPMLCYGTYTGFFFARAGILYAIVPDTLDFILSFGGAIPSRGEPWTAFAMGNAILNVHAGPVFIGGGLGFSTKEQETRKGGIDLVGNAGFDLFKKTTMTGSIFGEVRAPIITADRSFEEHHKLLLGFRMIF